MKIPQKLQESHSRLLVVIDTYHVIGWLAEGEELTRVFAIEAQKEKYTQEKQHIPTGDLRTENHVFHNHVAKSGASQLEKFAPRASKIIVFISPILRDEFLRLLNKPTFFKVTKVIDGDFIHKDSLELLERAILTK